MFFSPPDRLTIPLPVIIKNAGRIIPRLADAIPQGSPRLERRRSQLERADHQLAA